MEEQDFLLEKMKALETTPSAKTYQDEAPLNEKDEIIQELETQVETLKGQLSTATTDIEVRDKQGLNFKDK